MKKNRAVLLMAIISAALILTGFASAADSPHTDSNGVTCNSCHTLHAAPGASLTNNASNKNLCQSCHNAGSGNPKPMEDSMQATPGVSGTSHRWDASMPATSSPSNPHGLRASADLSNIALRMYLNKYGNVVTCSVCHNHHRQAATPWDPNAPAYVAGAGAGRHYQRIPNDLNQMCEDCHSYRVQTHAVVEGPGNGTTVFSHPVSQGLNANAKSYDNAAPLDANGVAQSGARFAAGGAGDGNDTNNLVFDSGNRVRCLSCHRMHYADSNSLSVDQP